MKLLIAIVICFFTKTSYGQFDKSFSLMATGNFDFKTKGLALNDAGFGIGLDGSLFSKHKLQLLLETSTDRFIGDKQFILADEGRENKSPAIYSIKVGPQFFISKNIALSTTFGPAWHSIQAIGFTRDYGFKFGATGFLGDKRRLVTKIFMVYIPKDNLNIRYFGLALGYRFF
jgi:hypothetical protein